jgi:arsenate reductase
MHTFIETPRELLRENGTPYAQLRLGDAHWTDDELIDRMLQFPILIDSDGRRISSRGY